MFTSCLEKQNLLKALFHNCGSQEAKYQKIMELGRHQAPLNPQYKIVDNVVRGCQSTMYLHSSQKGEHLIFAAESDALISSGLAAILIQVYSGETPETILKCPPHYLEDLGIGTSLTPSRANGLYSIHLRMKQDALKFLLAKGQSV